MISNGFSCSTTGIVLSMHNVTLFLEKQKVEPTE